MKNEKRLVLFISIIVILSIIAITPNTTATVSDYQIVSVTETGTNEITVVLGGNHCSACNPNDAGNPGCPEFTHGSNNGSWFPGETGYYGEYSVEGRYTAVCIGYGSGPTYVKQKVICNSTNWPLGSFQSKSFVFSGVPIGGGDTITIYGEMYCSWCGHWYAVPVNLTVSYGPVADANGPYNGYTNAAVLLDGSGSHHTDPSGNCSIISYEWDLDNDGQYDDATGVNPSHIWTSAGNYTIGLRVMDCQNITDTDTTTVIINDALLPICWWTGGGTIGTNRAPRVTHGFYLNCTAGANPLNNTLQVNWGGDHFHLNVLTRVECSDDPAIDPRPPRAGSDTIHGWGEGKYNGVSGFHVEFIFTDAGEPGRVDWAWIKITDSDTDTVMEVSGFLKCGNQQAHSL